jgi:tRNA (uracil-5-)-methyltransferase
LRIGYSISDTGLSESSIPTIEETVESPLVYGYRTKITPHFERPPKHIKSCDESEHPDWLKIGFNITNSQSTMDIEVSLAQASGLQLPNALQECPIATSVLNEKYKFDRSEIAK